jgi:hypothetical protein
MSRIGLTGAHRTGKTTLAKLWCEKTGIDFKTISMTEILADEGLRTIDIKDAETRLRIQRKAVERCDRVFGNLKTSFISDRTPIDVAAYTLTDAVEGFYKTSEQQEEALHIVRQCVDITNAYFNGVMMLRPSPSIGYKEEDGKPTADLAYQKNLDITILGLMMDLDVQTDLWVAPETSLKKRLRVLLDFHRSIIEDDVHSAKVVELM